MKYLMFGVVICFALCLAPYAAWPAEPGRVSLRGITVYGAGGEHAFPVIVRDTVYRRGKPQVTSGSLTIQFDVAADEPPQLKIRFLHCTRDWVVEDNPFLQDDQHNTSFTLEYKASPGGVRHYNYRYINRFPDARDIVRFTYSGNWMFRVMDKSETEVFAEGRFMVVDNISPVMVDISNEYMTELASPLNQVHKVKATVKLPDEIEGARYSAVDVYQNRRLHDPFRIDEQDRDPYTFVDGYNTGTRTFSISNIHPGNEYRVFDLSNATRYPNWAVARSLEGVDLPRVSWLGAPDHNGITVLNKFAGLNSDYLDVEFRFDPAHLHQKLTSGDRNVYLVSSFNAWVPSGRDTMGFDASERLFTTNRLLRRGVYDYQYVTGRLDEQQKVVEVDWLELEGNDWRTTTTYTVFVYYKDPRFSGIDRIVGYGTGESVSALPGSR